MGKSGFTLVEVLVSVAVVGVLAMIATPVYQKNIAQSQVRESFGLMESSRAEVIANLTKKAKCTPNGTTQTIQGLYGTLVISGTSVDQALKNPQTRLKTGCVFTYTFNLNNVSKRLAGKKVVADLLNNNVLSKSTLTNTEAVYLPVVFDTQTEETPPTSNVNVGNVDVAKDAPVPSTPLGTDSEPELESLTVSTGDLETIGVSTTSSCSYTAYKAIDIYALYSKKYGTPTAAIKFEITIPKGMAIIGDSVSTGAIIVGSNWKSGSQITINNQGAIVGRGGNAGNTSADRTGKPGGPAIVGGNAIVVVNNEGVIAGGGGGGDSWASGIPKVSPRAGGGAPYGKSVGTVTHSSWKVNTDAGLCNGGEADYWADGMSVEYEDGYGGKWGEAGWTGYHHTSKYDIEDQPYSTTALAGYKIQGLNVSIVNKGGKALGR